MINARERIHFYRSQGLEVEQGFDKPGKVYDWEAHEQTYLYTVAGSLLLQRKDKDTITLTPGSEIVVESGEPHYAEVGKKGWKYIAAWSAEEAAQFEH